MADEKTPETTAQPPEPKSVKSAEQEFTETVEAVTKHVKAAGAAIGTVYAKKIGSFLDTLRDALEEGDKKPRPKSRKWKEPQRD